MVGLSALAAGSFVLWKVRGIYKTPDLSKLNAKKELIAEIAETIIPATSSPGAKSAQVEDFIIKMVRDCTELKSQNSFMKGLDELEAYCTDSYGKTFINCNTTDRENILTHFEKIEDSNNLIHKIRRKLSGESFIYMFKNYTVIGYCTSELGATKGLAYDYIPSTYEACIPLKEKQRSWATK